jgi:hypothetical protein
VNTHITLPCFIVAVAAVSGCFHSNSIATSSSAVEALKDLDEQEGVLMHEVEGNCVFVIFLKPPPKDWQAVLDQAALAGNAATEGEFIAAGICADNERWRTYADSNTIGIATARDSKLVK